jgi:hypothetical protein
MDFLLDLLFSFVFEFLPSLLEERGRRPRAPEEQESGGDGQSSGHC